MRGRILAQSPRIWVLDGASASIRETRSEQLVVADGRWERVLITGAALSNAARTTTRPWSIYLRHKSLTCDRRSNGMVKRILNKQGVGALGKPERDGHMRTSGCSRGANVACVAKARRLPHRGVCLLQKDEGIPPMSAASGFYKSWSESGSVESEFGRSLFMVNGDTNLIATQSDN